MKRGDEKIISGCNLLIFSRWRMIQRTLVLWSAAAGSFQVCSEEGRYVESWPLQAV